MPYQSLYRRYRPQRFGEVIGQEHVTRTLRKAVRDNRVSHAYLFSGPRGTGKTSTARILAKALDCTQLQDGEPCGVCESCVQIAAGSSLDVMELDAASNNRVEDMRDLLARVALGSPGRSKVYIVDEVHMLSAAASNALLKTLEEPPGHVYFVLATTDPQRVAPTIRSRTQHFEFRLLPPDLLLGHLRWIVADAGLEVAPEAVELVARRGDGSVRDALSALDQAVAAGGRAEEEATPVDDLVEALCDRDAPGVLRVMAEACARGHDPRQLARELVEHLRTVFLSLMAGQLVGLADEARARVDDQGRRLGPAAVVRAIEVLGEALVEMRESLEPRIALEVALVRIARPDVDTSPAALLERLERLERRLAGHVTEPLADAARQAVEPRAPGVAPSAGADPEPASPPSQRHARRAGRSQDPRPAEPRAPETMEREGSAALAAEPRPAQPTGRASPAAAARAVLGVPGRDDGPPGRPVAASFRPQAAAPVPQALHGGEAGEADGELPTRDEVSLAWGDEVLAGLSPRAKSRMGVGRWVSVEEGAAVYALPNAVHRDRCEEFRGEAERALAARFGRPMPVRLVVDATPPPTEGPPPVEPDDDIELSELVDAPSAVPSRIDELKRVFPGAELVEE